MWHGKVVNYGMVVGATEGTTCESYTPWKIDMEPTNHPSRKENDLPNLHDSVPC